MCKKHHHHGGKSSESILDKSLILKNLNITSGMTIIDAGCGDGYMAKEFSKLTGLSGKVYAVDLHTESIEQLQKSTTDTNIEVFEADITKSLDIAANSVDLIYLSTVFHGFDTEHITGFNIELNRLLKAGGCLAVVEMIKGPVPFGPPSDMKFSPEELKDAVDLLPSDYIEIGDYFYMQSFIKE